MIISVCGPVGFEAAEKLYNEDPEAIKARFAGFFLRQFEKIKQDEQSEESIKTMSAGQIMYFREITDGGIYRALWEAGEELGCGIRISSSAIPVRQEVIEILEMFDISPYECRSKGSWLVVTEEEIEYPFIRIGVTTESRERIIEDGDKTRYLTPAKRQEKDLADHKRACCHNGIVL